MTALLFRLILVVGFVAYMAAIYLLLHMIVARVVRNPQSPVLWFFGVVTRPLTAPVRSMLPAGTPAPRVRVIALLAYAAVWLVSKVLLAMLKEALAGPGVQ